jgi:hypothetical protein
MEMNTIIPYLYSIHCHPWWESTMQMQTVQILIVYRSSSFYLVHYIDLYLVKKCMDIYVSMQTVPNFVLILIGLHWCYCLPSNNWMLIWWWWGFEWFTRMIFLNVALQYWFSVIIKIRLNGPNLSKICISK